MKITERIYEQIKDVDMYEEIDSIMESEGYYPIEKEEDGAEFITYKYSNGKSEIWISQVWMGDDYIVDKVSLVTKKRGSTKVRAFRSIEEIKSMMDWFREHERYDDFITFVLGMFLARRVGDTLSLKWSDFYYENGRKKDVLNTLIEDKTDKTVNMHITDNLWGYLDWYCGKTGVNPMENLSNDIFNSRWKMELGSTYTEKEYEEAIKKQAAAYRNQFKRAAKDLGIENVSTHSTRKSFGYIAHTINRYDPDCLDVLQTIYGHDSKETTKIYIDIMDEKAEKMFNDVANYVTDADNGIMPVIDNVPVVALKTNDLRELIKMAYRMGVNGGSEMDSFDKALAFADEKRLA